MFLQDKIKSGTIANEFLKPVNFMLRLLAENVGEGVFKIIFHFLPSVLLTLLFTELCPPASILHFLIMFISVIFGYLILWLISFIVQTWSFWLFSVWGIMTIKNVIVKILAGTLLPLWFMPEGLRKIIAFTPFEAIYFTPVQIYLGEVRGEELIGKMMVQLLWVVVLWIIAQFFWKKGTKKLVVQGG